MNSPAVPSRSSKHGLWLPLWFGTALLLSTVGIGFKLVPSDTSIGIWIMVFSVGLALVANTCRRALLLLYGQPFQRSSLWIALASQAVILGFTAYFAGVTFREWGEKTPLTLLEILRAQSVRRDGLRQWMWDLGLLYWIPMGLMLSNALLFSVKQQIRRRRPQWTWRDGLIRYGLPMSGAAIVAIAIPGMVVLSVVLHFGPRQYAWIKVLPGVLQDFIHETYADKELYELMSMYGYLSEERLVKLSLGQHDIIHKKWNDYELDEACRALMGLELKNLTRAREIALKIETSETEITTNNYVHATAGSILLCTEDEEVIRTLLKPNRNPSFYFALGLFQNDSSERCKLFEADLDALILNPDPRFQFFSEACVWNHVAEIRQRVLQSAYPEVRRRVLWFNFNWLDTKSRAKVDDWYIEQLRDKDPVIRAETIAQHVDERPGFSVKVQSELVQLAHGDPDINVRRLATEFFDPQNKDLPHLTTEESRLRGFAYTPDLRPETEAELAARQTIIAKIKTMLGLP